MLIVLQNHRARLSGGLGGSGTVQGESGVPKLVGSLANPSLPSLAIAEFLKNGGYDHHLRTIHRLHAEQMQYTIELLEQYFSAGTRVTRPSGGPVLWVELP